MQTQLKNDPFLFKASNGRTVDIEKLSAIVKSNDVIDVVQVLNRFEYESGYYPFYLQHTDLFNNAQQLFFNTFGLEPDIVIYSYKVDSSVSFFLFANKSLIDKSISDEEIELNLSGLDERIKHYRSQVKTEEQKGIEVNNLKVNEDSISVKLPMGAFPVIGAINSFDNVGLRRIPNFNLIFGSEYLKLLDDAKFNEINLKIAEPTIEGKDESKKWISNVDKHILSHFQTGISLYSIDKYDLNDEGLSKFYDPTNMGEFYKESIIKAKINFVDTIVSFILAINRGMYLPLTNVQFSSFLPHFYENYDRLYESVIINSSTKKNQLKRLYDTSLAFANKKSPNITCKNFIDYFLRDSIINFENLKSDPGKEILKAFQKQQQIPKLIGPKEILSRFIKNGLPNENYENFLNSPDGQVEAKNKIYRIL